jgi:polyferredoxin
MLGFTVAGTFLVGLRHILPGEAASGGAFDAFCPFGAIENLSTYLSRGETLLTTSLLNFAMLGGVMAVSLVAGRAFCGWICPLGALQEGLAGLARRLTGERRRPRGKPSQASLPLRVSPGIDRRLRLLKYVVLAAVLLASTFAVYPPLHPLCPARAVFSFKLESALLWSVLLAFVAVSLLVERAWCKYLCPLGAALAIFNKLSPLRLRANFERCTRCGRCEVDCSMAIEALPDNLSHPECIRCMECLETCARTDALTLKLGKP